MILSLFYQFFAIIKPINFHLYHYAGNNPIRYVDPDGREIEVNEDIDITFKKSVEESIEYLKKSDVGRKIIESLEKSPIVFSIRKCNWLNSDDKDCYDDNDETIYWSARHTIEGNNGEYNSPAICLMHELTHAWESKTYNGKRNFLNFKKINHDKLSKFDNEMIQEEFATASEAKVANQLGEPTVRKRYLDQKRVQGFSVTVVVSGPLCHSKGYIQK